MSGPVVAFLATLAVGAAVFAGLLLLERRSDRRWAERQAASHRARDENADRLAALTDEDRAWLAEMGWQSPVPEPGQLWHIPLRPPQID